MRKLVILLAVILNAAIAFCGGTQYIRMAVGEQRTLIVPSSVTSKTLRTWTWSCGSYNIKLTSKGFTTCTIEAMSTTMSSGEIVRFSYEYWVTSGRYSYSVRDYYDFNIVIAANPNPNQTIELDYSSISVNEGEVDFKLLEATVSPSYPSDSISWRSGNTDILTVKSGTSTVNGQKKFYCYVTTKVAGTVTITATCNGGVSASCRVTVIGHTYASVVFHPNWDTKTPWSKTYAQDEPFGRLPELVAREGYIFVGWYTEDGSLVTPSSIMPAHDIDLYARWKEVAPSIEGDSDAEIKGGYEEGYVIKLSEVAEEVVIGLDDGLASEKVTVELDHELSRLTLPKGTRLKIVCSPETLINIPPTSFSSGEAVVRWIDTDGKIYDGGMLVFNEAKTTRILELHAE